MSGIFKAFPISSAYLAGPIDHADPTDYYKEMLDCLPKSIMVFLPGRGQYERAIKSYHKTYMVDINKFAMFESDLVIFKYPKNDVREGTTRELVWLADALESGYYNTGTGRGVTKHNSIRTNYIILWLQGYTEDDLLSCYLQYDIDRLYRLRGLIFKKCYSLNGVTQAIKDIC